jgi:serine/threonine-protein kinase RsbW
VIRVRVPGTLAYRNLALRVVAAATKMIGNAECEPSPALEELEAQTVSAVGEAFNNIAIHAYKGVAPGEIDVLIESDAERVVVEMTDTGASFDPSTVAVPELDELPENGMGLFIIRSFMDEVTYAAGPPKNVLRLVKRRAPGPEPRLQDGASEAEVTVETGAKRATADDP